MFQKGDNVELEIILILLREDLHLRGIARSLGESPATVHRKVKKLVDENVLDYRTAGKNKVFRVKKNLQAKNYVFNAERYKLIKLLRACPELEIIFEDLLKSTGEDLVVLFGSYARFDARKDSDVDIYVDSEDRNAKAAMEMVHSKVRVKLGAFDPDSHLIKEIIKNHVILKGVETYYEKTRFFA